MEADEIENFHYEVRDRNIVTTELKTTWYGMREFDLKDNNGYVPGFAEKPE
ncbi:MAG: hypothetical protein LBQ54_12220 [Planctomycetaceae bacterium]|jgi:hypothetical protein|nr:hypothetical protein [Planctomycetaceae bacterium]